MTKKEIVCRLKNEYPEVFAAQRRKQLLKVLKVLLMDSVLIALGVLSKPDFDARGFGTEFMISVTFLCVFVAFMCKPWFAILAPIRSGRIVKLDVVTIQGSKDSKFLTTLADVEKKHNMIKIIVEDDDKSSFVMTLKPQCAKTMRLGDELVKLPVEYPIVMTAGNPKRLCPICGNIVPATETECIGCGNKFIKFD